jgi:predicted permease
MRSLLLRVRWALTRRRREAELQEEIEFHLQEDLDERTACGFTEDESRIAARREFGNRTLVEEDARTAWGWTWLERLGQDVRYAGRMVRRRPGFAAAAIVTLSLGIGANTAVFSILHALLLRSLPVDRPESLVRLVEQPGDESSYRDAFTLVTHTTLEHGTKALAGVIASSVEFSHHPREIEERGERVAAFVQLVSDNYFEVLGVRAFRGRLFHQADSGTIREPIAIISEEYWRRHYGKDASALGAHFRWGNREFTIAGIAPPEFRGTDLDVPIDIWLSIDQVVPAGSVDRLRGRWMRIMARLQPGVALAAAEGESTAIVGRPVRFQAGATGYSTLRRQLGQPLLLLEVVVSIVLVITCANLANLMLASTASREREIAVRRAIGASDSRIVRQLLTESLLLSAVGGAFAVVVAQWVSAALLGFLPPEQAPALVNLRFEPDPDVLGFAALLSGLTCLMFGLVPARRAARSRASLDVRSGGGMGQRHKNWFSRSLLVSQVALCTLLLMVAGVFLRTLHNLRSQETGYTEDRLMVADVNPPREYPEDRRDRLIEDLRTRAAQLPGVEVAGFSYLGQLSGFSLEYRIGFPGRRSDAADAIEQRISPGFLRAMGTAFTAGRDFGPSDDARSAPVAIVNESFARRFLPGRSPLGARFFQEGGSRSGQLMEIVGVVRDSKWLNLRDDSPAMYYRPYSQQAGSPAVRLAIRTSGDPDALARELRRTAQAIDQRIVLTNVVPFRDIVNRTLVVERLVGQVSTAFGVLALLIAAVGLYGVLAYTVARRRREIGVRIALGAPPGAVEWMILHESLTLLACGVVIGVPLALIVTRFLSSMLFGLGPNDPGTIGAAIVILTLATTAAAYVPARQAATTSPILALREE